MAKGKKTYLSLIKEIQTKKDRVADFLGIKIITHRNVFPVDSPFSFSSMMTAKTIPKNAGIVLDIGTGTGVQAIIAAKRGAKKVIAIDIDENSLKNAEENIRFHHLEKIIKIRKSDLFKNIKKDEKFDLILSNLPLADKKLNIPFRHFLFDADFKLHEILLKNSKKHLNQNGKLFIPSGDIANEKRLNELIKKYNYKIIKITEKTFRNLKWKLYVLTIR